MHAHRSDRRVGPSRREGLGLIAIGMAGLAGSVCPVRAAALTTTGDPQPTARFDAAGSSSGWQRLSLAGGLLIIDARLNDHAIGALLDSGAGRTVLDRALARQLGISTRTGFRAGGVTSVIDGELADGLKVGIGAMTVAPITAAVLDLSQLSRHSAKPISLILGRELFETTLVEIDFATPRIEFLDRRMFHAGPHSQQLALRANAYGSRYFPVSVDGGPPVDAVFDLGNAAPLLMSPAYAAQSGALDGRRVSTAAGMGVEGLVNSRVAVLDRVRIGDVEIAGVPVQIPDGWNRSSPLYVGLPVLSRFKVLTDYAGDRLLLTPIPGMIEMAFDKDRSGIGAERLPTAIRIVHVADNSPAMLIGLKVGDEIVAVNGQTIDSTYFKNNPSMGGRPAGTVFSLTLSDGRTMILTLADYY